MKYSIFALSIALVACSTHVSKQEGQPLEAKRDVASSYKTEQDIPFVEDLKINFSEDSSELRKNPRIVFVDKDWADESKLVDYHYQIQGQHIQLLVFAAPKPTGGQKTLESEIAICFGPKTKVDPSGYQYNVGCHHTAYTIIPKLKARELIEKIRNEDGSLSLELETTPISSNYEYFEKINHEQRIKKIILKSETK